MRLLVGLFVGTCNWTNHVECLPFRSHVSHMTPSQARSQEPNRSLIFGNKPCGIDYIEHGTFKRSCVLALKVKHFSLFFPGIVSRHGALARKSLIYFMFFFFSDRYIWSRTEEPELFINIQKWTFESQKKQFVLTDHSHWAVPQNNKRRHAYSRLDASNLFVLWDTPIKECMDCFKHFVRAPISWFTLYSVISGSSLLSSVPRVRSHTCEVCIE